MQVRDVQAQSSAESAHTAHALPPAEVFAAVRDAAFAVPADAAADPMQVFSEAAATVTALFPPLFRSADIPLPALISPHRSLCRSFS